MDGARDTPRPHLRLVVDGTEAGGEEKENALGAAVLAGNRDALRELFAGNEAVVLAVARRHARTPTDTREIVEQTFLRVLRAARRALRKDAQRAVPFRRWLIRTSLKVAEKHLRDEVHFACAGLDQVRPVENQPAVGAEAADTATARMLREVIELPRRQREVLTLGIDAELPLAEIGDVLGITENAAKLNLHQASQRLQKGARGGEGMPACRKYETSLTLRAIGALERAEGPRIEAHLAGCAACSVRAQETVEVLERSALAPASAEERKALHDLPARVLEAIDRSEQRRAVATGAFVPFTLAVLVIVLALAFFVLRGGTGELAPEATEILPIWEAE